MWYLWIIAGSMVVLGAIVIAVSLTGALGPVALICGVLLLWSGIVKAVVLRIWRSTLKPLPGVTEGSPLRQASARQAGRLP